MTAKVIQIPVERTLTDEEVDYVVQVAQDVYCPEVITPRLLEIIIAAGRSAHKEPPRD